MYKNNRNYFVTTTMFVVVVNCATINFSNAQGNMQMNNTLLKVQLSRHNKPVLCNKHFTCTSGLSLICMFTISLWETPFMSW